MASSKPVAHTSTASPRRRALVVTVAVLIVAAAAAVTVVVVTRSSATPRPADNRSSAATLRSVTTFRLAGAEVPATGAKSLPDGVLAGVLSTLNRYLDGAVIAPMKSGRAATDLPALFTATAAQRLGGPDRATLVDDGGPAGQAVGIDDASTTLTGLAGGDGSISMVAAKVDVVVRAGPPADATRVARSGELVLVPDGGAWRIDGYDLWLTKDPLPPPPTTVRARGKHR